MSKQEIGPKEQRLAELRKKRFAEAQLKEIERNRKLADALGRTVGTKRREDYTKRGSKRAQRERDEYGDND